MSATYRGRRVSGHGMVRRQDDVGRIGPGQRGQFSIRPNERTRASPILQMDRLEGPTARRFSPGAGGTGGRLALNPADREYFRSDPTDRQYHTYDPRSEYFRTRDTERGIPQIDDFREHMASLEGATFDRGYNRLRPGMEDARRALTTRLANQGIVAGSEAYNAELDRLDRSQNSALENLALSSVAAGRGEHSRLTGLAAALQGQEFGQQMQRLGFDSREAQRETDNRYRGATFAAGESARRFSEGMGASRFDAGESGRRFGEGLAGDRFDQSEMSRLFGQHRTATDLNAGQDQRAFQNLMAERGQRMGFNAGERARGFQERLQGSRDDFSQRLAATQTDASEAGRTFAELLAGQGQQHRLNQVNRDFDASERSRDFRENLDSENSYFRNSLAADQFASQAAQFAHSSAVQQQQFGDRFGLDADRDAFSRFMAERTHDRDTRWGDRDRDFRRYSYDRGADLQERGFDRDTGWGDRDRDFRERTADRTFDRDTRWGDDDRGFRDRTWDATFDRDTGWGDRDRDFRDRDWDRTGDWRDRDFSFAHRQWRDSTGFRDRDWERQGRWGDRDRDFRDRDWERQGDWWNRDFDRQGQWYNQQRGDARRGSMWGGIGSMAGSILPFILGGGGGNAGAGGEGGGGFWSRLGKGALSALPFLGMFSDERLKDDHGVVDVVPIHEWNYKGDDKTYVGPMAQDVERVMPKAVGRVGRRGVRYLNVADVLSGVAA